MKKLVSLVLAVLMLASSAFAESAFDKHVDYEGAGWMLNADANYDDAYYAFMAEKFNISVTPFYSDSATNDEKLTLLVNTDSMPDTLNWLDFNFDSYIEWVDQGLLAPLPEGWETDYPNLYKNLQKTGILEKITVDGKVYCVPHVVFANFVDVDVPVYHHFIYYREDWAKELGITIGETITPSELRAFCKAAMDANLGDNGKTVGLTAAKGVMRDMFFVPLGYYYTSFHKDENGYFWGPAQPGMTGKIAEMREWYESGILDPDFYLGNSMETFCSGSAAAYFYEGAANSAKTMYESFVNGHADMLAAHNKAIETDPGLYMWQTTDVQDRIGLTVMADEAGVPYSYAGPNYWAATLYSPNIDPEVQARVLAITDWQSTKEGQVSIAFGIPNVDWKWANEEQTAIEIINTVAYDSSFMFTTLAMCSDENAFIDEKVPQEIRDFVPRMYEIKNTGNIVMKDIDYTFFASESKANYSVDVGAKIIELVVDSTKDIESEWAKFVQDNMGMVEPLLADLNAEFFGK